MAHSSASPTNLDHGTARSHGEDIDSKDCGNNDPHNSNALSTPECCTGPLSRSGLEWQFSAPAQNNHEAAHPS
eukprot:11639491-Karenia_brevis.AAC.1